MKKPFLTQIISMTDRFPYSLGPIYIPDPHLFVCNILKYLKDTQASLQLTSFSTTLFNSFPPTGFPPNLRTNAYLNCLKKKSHRSWKLMVAFEFRGS